MWIDVEGSSKKVLTGAEKSLKNTFSILIETEECPYWKDQWLRKDVENYLKSLSNIFKLFFPLILYSMFLSLLSKESTVRSN